jgi:hypothetical protein
LFAFNVNPSALNDCNYFIDVHVTLRTRTRLPNSNGNYYLIFQLGFRHTRQWHRVFLLVIPNHNWRVAAFKIKPIHFLWMEADGPILKLFLNVLFVRPNIYLLEPALHPWCLFYSEFHLLLFRKNYFVYYVF